MSAQLGAAIRLADIQVSTAEAAASLVDARLRLVDAALCDLKHIAAVVGVEVSDVARPGAISAPHSFAPNLSEPEFAKLMGVSQRTIAKDRKAMTETVHFHLHGRRVLYHVPEAADFIRARGRASLGSDADLVVDEVTKRRARAALRKSRAAR